MFATEARPLASAPRKYASIQALRAFAATMVLLYHANVLSIGYAGVDIFFIISGFVMGKVGGNERPIEFAGKRMARIVPLYWTITLLVCGLSLVPGLFRHFEFDSSSLLYSLLFVPYYDPEGHVWPLIVPGWTLNYEMFFYIIFTVSLLTWFPRSIASFAIVSLVALRLVFSQAGAVSDTYTNPMLLEFVVGLLLSAFRIVPGLIASVILLSAGVVSFGALNFADLSNIGTWGRVLCLGIPSVLIVFGSVFVEMNGFWPRVRLIEAIGDSSFSLYLLHGPIVSFAERFLHVGLVTKTLVVLTLSGCLAILSYTFFEKPAANLFRRKLFRSSKEVSYPSTSCYRRRKRA